MQNNLVIRISKIHSAERHIALKRDVGDRSVRLMGVLPGPQTGPLRELRRGSFRMLRTICIRILSAGLLFHIDKLHIAVVLLRLFIQKPEDTIRSGKRRDDGIELHGNLIDWHIEAFVERKERSKRTDRKAGILIDRQRAANHGTDHIRGISELRAERSHNSGISLRLIGNLEQLLVQLIKGLRALFLMTEHLDHLLAGNRLLNKAVQFSESSLPCSEIFCRNLRCKGGQRQHHGHHHTRKNRQRNAQCHHHCKDRNNRDRTVHQLRNALTDHLAQRINIVCVNRHDVAVCMGVKIFDRQGLHMIKQIISKIPKRSLCDVNHKLCLHQGGKNTKPVKPRNAKNGPRKRPVIRIRLPDHRRNVAVNQGLGKHSALYA